MATEKIVVPDFGDVQEITVVELYVSVGDRVEVEDSLIALESEKAVMDIPSPCAGVVKEMYLKEEDVVTSGDAIALVELEDSAGRDQVPEDISPEAEKPEVVAGVPEKVEQPDAGSESPPALREKEEVEDDKIYHATPSLRAYARELGVELSWVTGTGPKGRIVKEDVQKLVKKALQGGGGKGPSPAMGSDPFAVKPLEDFSKYGTVEEVSLGRIQKISGPHLHRSWVNIPHVTHFDEADITELESFRKKMNKELAEDGIKISPLIFVIKAVVATLKRFPTFNSSLDQVSEKLVLKHYCNMGIAVDTPNGLVVPVIKNVEKMGIRETAVELGRLSNAARDGKLGITDMQGSSFTISSLGGIGGTGFTPIINAPEVAILGLSRNYMRPAWDGEEQSFVPRLTLPFSLSYDHRVIDGAEAARFCKALKESLEDLRRALL